MVTNNTNFICLCVEICGTKKRTYFCWHYELKMLFFDKKICFRIHIENRLTKHTWLQKQIRGLVNIFVYV